MKNVTQCNSYILNKNNDGIHVQYCNDIKLDENSTDQYRIQDLTDHPFLAEETRFTEKKAASHGSFHESEAKNVS